jgi:hypothetical protein
MCVHGSVRHGRSRAVRISRVAERREERRMPRRMTRDGQSDRLMQFGVVGWPRTHNQDRSSPLTGLTTP